MDQDSDEFRTSWMTASVSFISQLAEAADFQSVIRLRVHYAVKGPRLQEKALDLTLDQLELTSRELLSQP